ncbi:E3 ubiquitin-protein ligase TRIM45-like [Ptychodera flava]|uniref:E3 ubiquitin-protein ligase TRIM45-like n=1 Tax=Ptychodera flava TaxID=63121 RepID=UPI003969C64E
MSDEEEIIEDEGEEVEERDPLVCPICEEHYDDPRLLPCLHNVCRTCLMKKFGGKKGIFNCPVCNEKVATPKPGLDGFPRNALIVWQLQAEGNSVTKCRNCEDDSVVYSWCGNCLQFLCETCHEAHLRVPLSREHNLITVEELEETDSESLEEYRRMVVCRKHNQRVEKLCRKCNVVICKRCTVTDHDPDRGHDIINLEVAVAHYKEVLEQLGQAATKRSRLLKKKVRNVQEENRLVDDECSYAELDLDKHFDTLERYVDEHRERMRKKLEAAYALKEQEIENKKRDANEALHCIKEAIEMSKEVTKDKHSDDEMIAVMGRWPQDWMPSPSRNWEKIS